MRFDRAGSVALLIVPLVLVAGVPVWAGGTSFQLDEDRHADVGPSYFGFVRDASGVGVPNAQVTAQLKDRGPLVTHTDIMGVYKIPGFGKDIDPNDVSISCAKDGYKQVRTLRRPRGDAKDPVETECYLERK
jgi:hypothetical protein